MLQNEDRLPADTVVVAIGDVPDLDFIKTHLAVDNGYVTVDRFNRTSDPKVFAIGDVVAPGLITEAIGAGKRMARVIHQIAAGESVKEAEPRPVVDNPGFTWPISIQIPFQKIWRLVEKRVLPVENAGIVVSAWPSVRKTPFIGMIWGTGGLNTRWIRTDASGADSAKGPVPAVSGI